MRSRPEAPCPCEAPAAAKRRLLRALSETPPRLDLALLSVATLEQPELEEEPVLKELDALAERVREKGCGSSSTTPPLNLQLSALRDVLSREEGFTGDRERYFCPENSFLQQVLQRRRGLPITLGCLYIEVGRRVGVDIFGINFPGHFLIGAREGSELFVLDPFHGGHSLDTEALETLLSRMAPDLELCPALLAPATVEQITWRVLSNLRRVYLKDHDVERALGVVELMLTLAPDHPGELRTRAQLCAKLGAFKAALRDVERCLELTPDAPDACGLRKAREQLIEKTSQLN